MNQDIFEKASIPKAVATFALPTVLSMLVVIIYNMADTFFVGQTGDPNQVAAVSLATPVFLLLMAFGNMFGIGGSTLISRKLGEKNTDQVKHISSFCFYGCIAVGLLLTAIFIIGMPLILQLIGSSSDTAGYARDYLFYIGCGAVFIVTSNAFGNILRGEGAVKQSMFGMMLGTIVNIILDPIMILSMNMGVAGAAIATIIGNICSIIYYVYYLLKKSSLLSISPKHFTLKDGIPAGVFVIGVPASINNILMSMANILLNNYLASYGDVPVAAMGVAMKANILVVLLQMGLAMGIQPLVAYCFGSKNYSRMKNVMKFTIMCTITIGTVLTVVYLCFTRNIIKGFIDNTAVIGYGISMLKALMLSGPVLGILFVFMFTFQAMGKAIPSLILSISRQGLVFLPVLIISNSILGLNGIIWAQPIADIISLVMAFLMFILLSRKMDLNAKEPVDTEMFDLGQENNA